MWWFCEPTYGCSTSKTWRMISIISGRVILHTQTMFDKQIHRSNFVWNSFGWLIRQFLRRKYFCMIGTYGVLGGSPEEKGIALVTMSFQIWSITLILGQTQVPKSVRKRFLRSDAHHAKWNTIFVGNVFIFVVFFDIRLCQKIRYPRIRFFIIIFPIKMTLWGLYSFFRQNQVPYCSTL